MEAYIADWLNLLVRWLHVIAGVAWIGASFYFIWLDDHLEPPRDPADDEKGVGGEVWSVHGGGFYHAQKYKAAPQQLPERLHWFKWEAYTTWLSGIFLTALVYWYGAEVYLIDRSVADFSSPVAVGIAIAFIVGGWLVYDVLCKSPLARDTRVFRGILLLLCALLAWGLCELFSGRGAYIHFGAVLGTIMVANVFFVIIPGQKQMVAAAERGETPDPTHGQRGKQRSVHNTYFTLPVLFVMTSNHFAMAYGHEYNWLILIGISLAGALIRIYFVARHKGRHRRCPPSGRCATRGDRRGHCAALTGDPALERRLTRFATSSTHAAQAVIRLRRVIPRSRSRRSASCSTPMNRSSPRPTASTSRRS